MIPFFCPFKISSINFFLFKFILNHEFSDDIEFDDAQNINGFFSGDELTIDDLDYDDVSDDESDMETE